MVLVNEKQRKTWVSRVDGKTDTIGAFFSQRLRWSLEARHEAKEKGKGDKTEIKENHPDATPQFASPNQLSEHGGAFHQPMEPIKSLFGFRVARVIMSEQE